MGFHGPEIRAWSGSHGLSEEEADESHGSQALGRPCSVYLPFSASPQTKPSPDSTPASSYLIADSPSRQPQDALLVKPCLSL